MKTPDPNNLYIGAGEVFFDRKDANGASTGLRHLGNADELSTNVSIDTLVKKSSMSGARGVLKEVITGTIAEIGLSLSEYASENVAIALLGSEGPFTQAADPAIVAGVINGGVALVLDRWYDLGALAVTVTALKQGATTLNIAAYEVRADVGMIRLLSSYTGAGAATAAITTWDGSKPAILAAADKRVVQALAVGKIEGHLRYISNADQASGPRIMVDVWNVQLIADGDVALIGEDFGTFKLKGKAQLDATKPAGEQYIKVTYL